MFDIIRLEVTDFAQNCSILTANTSYEAVVVDPGGDVSSIINVIEQNKLKLVEIWLTHSHLDHCGGVMKLLEYKMVPLLGHQNEARMRRHVEDVARMYGLTGFDNCPEPTRYLQDGDIINFADNHFKVLFTPGHSPGHLCFYSAKSGRLIAGDTVFKGSIGRTDLPGGDFPTLEKSIREKIYTLPEETIIYPGHGSETTVGVEKRTNPFVTS